MKKIIIILVLASVGLGAYVLLKDKPSTGKTASAAASKTKDGKTPQQNVIAQEFTKKGVEVCNERINQVTNYLSAGSTTAGVFLFLPEKKPDEQLVSASMETIYKDGKSGYASANFAPVEKGGCQVVYDAIVWFPEACNAVLASQYPNQKVESTLKQNISVVSLGANTRVFLMPAGEGCVSIKKEVVYN